MRIINLFLVSFISLSSFCQPANSIIQSDIKKELGPNCISVSVGSGGNTSTEYVNGGYRTFYRVSVSAKIKTDVAGVTKTANGAAKYAVNGRSYSFIQYAPGNVEYSGLAAPDTSAIRKYLLSMPDYGFGQAGWGMVDVKSILFVSKPAPVWHTMLSVSIPVEVISTQKANGENFLETVKIPQQLRLYRNSATEPWHNLAWLNPDYGDDRQGELLAREAMGSYAMSKLTSFYEKAQMKAAEKQAAERPKVEIPTMNTIKDIMKWYHDLLMEGNYETVEAVTLDLMHPDNFDKNTKLINGIGSDLLRYIKIALTNDYSTYNKQNCPNPEIESTSNEQISWWNKDKSRRTSLRIKIENGRWFIHSVGIYVWDFNQEAYANKTHAAVCKR